MKSLLILFSICSLFICTNDQHVTADQSSKTKLSCNDEGCIGRYKGPEFVNGSDVAHQFSNSMSKAVGDALKENYRDGLYTKVDFANIKMTTKGMGSGKVNYSLSIPFVKVDAKCDAYTSFDHVGGWNHTPELSRREQELSKALIPGQRLDISELKTTPEGLQEYWIQWKNKKTQAECE